MDAARSVDLGSWARRSGEGWVLRLDPDLARPEAFGRSVLEGLGRRPRTLDCRWLYDATGSALYERITATEEYYPTRTEAGILARHAPAIREAAGPCALVELGSGSSVKTRHLIDAWAARGPVHYAPIDVSPSALEGACEDLARRYPGARIEALATGYGRGLAGLGALRPKLVMFLGSTLGNYDPDQTRAFLGEVRDRLRPGDHLLLGIDRVKPAPILEAAYDDAQGWTRRFILNLFARMNRELAAGVPLDALRYEARYEAEAEQVEMWVHVRRPFTLRVEGQAIALEEGAAIRVEISRKFRPERLVEVATGLGLQPRGHWSDPRAWFSVLLFAR